GAVSDTHSTPTPARSPIGPEAPASDDTPITTSRARTGLTRIAAMVHRSPRQNHDAVVCARSPAAVIGIVATSTRIAACRQMISRTQPIAAGTRPKNPISPAATGLTALRARPPREVWVNASEKLVTF